jgi:adsorption protein B
MIPGVETTLIAGHFLLGEFVLVLALLLALSALDDLAVDLLFIRHLARRRVGGGTRPTAESVAATPPAPMAIIIPAWDEAAVIGAMLTRLLASLDYPDFRVFVGLYPNDPATIAAVAAITDPRVERVMGNRPGPTTKSDCLNHLWRAVLADEVTTGRRFKAVVLHDAEDVVHPLALRLHNAMIPRLAMVQLPVVPFVDPDSPWVAGHYLDEFATNHIKDLVVREQLGAGIPSAGVGCAIDRNFLARIGADGDPFDPACLTEDYELGLRIRAMGGATALVRMRDANGAIIGTREHFPASFATARRQKTRWFLGIALAGWDRIGWLGGGADRYMLMRDRKVVAAALVTILAYAATLLIGIDALLVATVPAVARLPPLFGPLASALVTINIALLVWRLLVRAACTTHGHGWTEGLRSVPRALVGNVINAAAAWAACRRYSAALRDGSALGWDKTAHRFPAPVAA